MSFGWNVTRNQNQIQHHGKENCINILSKSYIVYRRIRMSVNFNGRWSLFTLGDVRLVDGADQHEEPVKGQGGLARILEGGLDEQITGLEGLCRGDIGGGQVFHGGLRRASQEAIKGDIQRSKGRLSRVPGPLQAKGRRSLTA